jgi:hypothetical protein
VQKFPFTVMSVAVLTVNGICTLATTGHCLEMAKMIT